MTTILPRLIVEALLVCALSAVFWLLENKTPFGRLNYKIRRVVIGLSFGCAAVLLTHYGIGGNDTVETARDMAPLSAGLLFDPLSGLIAGVIGGVDRIISGQFFMLGSYTAYAGGITTIFAGLLAFLLKKYLFEGKKPNPFYSFTITAIVEVVQLLLILVLDLSNISISFEIVRASAVPLLVVNSAAMALQTGLFYLLSGQRKKKKRRDPSETPVTFKIQFWLLIFITAACVFSFAVTYASQTNMTVSNAQTVLKLNEEDIKNGIQKNQENLQAAESMLKTHGLSIAHAVANDVQYAGGTAAVSVGRIKELAEMYGIYEINVIDSGGIITVSTNDSYAGFDMASGSQSAAFLVLLDGTQTELTQDFQPITYNSSVSVMYVGVSMPGGMVQVGFDKSSIENVEKLADISTVVSDRHIGQKGGAYVIQNGEVISGTEGVSGVSTQELGLPAGVSTGSFFRAVIDGSDCYCYLRNYNDYRILVTMNAAEMYGSRDIVAYATAFAEILLFALIYILIYILVRRIIVRNLDRVNESLAKITEGDLNEVVNVRSSMEFTSLSQDINSTVDTLKDYISEAENRINQELEFAKAIQASALPNIFPPFPEHREFELFALMGTAKEVGGDFYDFFMTDDTHLVMVIADVSDKGIPASLFMMKSKTLIKSLAETGRTPKQIMEDANRELCRGNDAEMFVTVWLGMLDLKTGIMRTVNAGHEYPAVMHAGGEYELFRDRHGFIMAGMETSLYQEDTLTLKPGDSLFLYTDGVTEATDADKCLFGTERMLAALNAHKRLSPEKLLPEMKREIDAFAGDAPQFDDITMLAIRIQGVSNVDEITVKATLEELAAVQEFVEVRLRNAGCPMKTIMQVSVAVEEIYVNIARYAYHPEVGEATIRCGVDTAAGLVEIQFLDGGKPFDPLAKKDADTTLSADEREIGGLGILMVKKSMDAVTYSYRDGKNILTIKKSIAGQ